MIDLDQLQEGHELNPLAYDPGKYPDLSEMLDFIELNQNKPAVNIDLKNLSINGEAKRDLMEYYLKSKNISSSNLKCALKSPRTFFYDWEGVFEEKDKSHFELGTFAHMAFMEPWRFKMVKTLPDIDFRKNDSITKGIEFLEGILNLTHQDYSGMKQDQLKTIYSNLKSDAEFEGFQLVKEEHSLIVEALEKNYNWYGGGIIKSILKGAISEVSFYGQDRETGLNLKVRPDYLNIAENIGVNAVISFKTTRADDLGKFFYDAAKYDYHLSEGMYLDFISKVTGRDFNVTITIMLQTVPPYDVAVLFWDADDLEAGKYKYRQALWIVKECFDKKIFPGFDAMAEKGDRGITRMFLPEWSRKLVHPTSIDY